MWYRFYYVVVVLIYILLAIKGICYLFKIKGHDKINALLDLVLALFKFIVGFFIVYNYNFFSKQLTLTYQDQEVIFSSGFLVLTIAFENLSNIEKDIYNII
jgi:hypothetical protein